MMNEEQLFIHHFEVGGFDIDLAKVETNIVRARISEPIINSYQFVFKAAETDVLLNPLDMHNFRAVTRLDVDTKMIPHAVELPGKTLKDRNNN